MVYFLDSSQTTVQWVCSRLQTKMQLIKYFHSFVKVLTTVVQTAPLPMGLKFDQLMHSLWTEYIDASSLRGGRKFSLWNCGGIWITLDEWLVLYFALIKRLVCQRQKWPALNHLVDALRQTGSIEYLDPGCFKSSHTRFKKVTCLRQEIAYRHEKYTCKRLWRNKQRRTFWKKY